MIPFANVDVDEAKTGSPEAFGKALISLSGKKTVPMVFI
jgi:hypothetical protein